MVDLMKNDQFHVDMVDLFVIEDILLVYDLESEVLIAIFIFSGDDYSLGS